MSVWHYLIFAIFIWLCVAIVFAYFVHIYWSVRTLARDDGATAGQIVLALVGPIVFPIAIFHGLMIIWGTRHGSLRRLKSGAGRHLGLTEGQ